jgi:hypothetical protein
MNPILRLQGAIGNQAVQRLLQTKNEELKVGSTSRASLRFGHHFAPIPVCAQKPEKIQTRLAVSVPGDVYEQEADRVADEVMRMPDQSGAMPKIHPVAETAGVNRQCASCAAREDAGGDLSSMVAHGTSGGGQALDAQTRGFMEARFGLDFSHVRVHTSSSAAQSARGLNALAYTVGNNIVFAEGRYAPQTDSGRRLLAHELVHTVQQGGDAASRPFALQAGDQLQKSCRGNNGGRHTCVQRLAGEDGTGADSGFYDDAGPDEARAALIAALGEERVRLLEDFTFAGRSQNGEIAAMRTAERGSTGITHTVDGPAVMAAGAAAVIGGIAAAIVICAVGWFFYTDGRYGSKSDKWKHCFCSCKIASYCGAGLPVVGSVISLLIGGGKELADGIGDVFGLQMQMEWEDFVADAEGAFLCGLGGVFSSSCYDCCEKKRGSK